MTQHLESDLQRGAGGHAIEVADESLTYRSLTIADGTPTGAQMARAAGFKPPDAAIVLEVEAAGGLRIVDPASPVDLGAGSGRFIIVASDRLYIFDIDGERFEWPVKIVSGAVIRTLGAVAADKALYLERVDQPDRLIESQDLINLDRAGIETFRSRQKLWKLNVHGVVIDVAEPTILVSEALTRAGFDATKPWHIYLKVVGQAKQEVGLGFTVDLRTPGIEKLRLTPRDVGNGEAPPAPRRDFALLEADTAYLGRLGLKWETIIELERRWLLIRNFPLPPGYTVTHTLLALEIPPNYPQAAIYGFYAFPPLALTSATAIPSTQMRGTILSEEFHGWSRHRGAHAPWNPAIDNVVTHLGLVEAALLKETGE